MNESTVSLGQVVAASEAVLPVRVQEALGELVGAAREGLLALSVGVGLGVLVELMEEEVDEVVGPKGRHDPARTAVRHGHEAGAVTLGGRRVGLERPRVRSADGVSELPLATYRYFADGTASLSRSSFSARCAAERPSMPSLPSPRARVDELMPYALAIHYRLVSRVPAYNWPGCAVPWYWTG